MLLASTLALVVKGALLRRGAISSSTQSLKKRACKTKADPFDCFTGNGEDYVGLKTSSMSGRKCKNWIVQGKNGATVSGIGNHNYCRNPKGSKDKPWCFVVDPEKDWEYCEVPKCKDAGEPPKPWVAPKGAKSEEAEGKGPCEYKAPEKPLEEYKAGRACMDSRGDKYWLIGMKKSDVADAAACKGECDTLPGSEYFTYFGAKDDDGKNCGCYRECVLVEKDLTVNDPTIYKMG